MEYGPVLARCPLFRGMGAEELPALLDCLGAAPRRVEKGETILAAGTRPPTWGWCWRAGCR